MTATAAPVVAVAVSGGRDSTALLHATCRQARALGLQVVALHVHHGLVPQADQWVQHLGAQIGRWRRAGLPVRLEVARLSGLPQPGDSIEAWARRERYAALQRMAHDAGADLVLLAHHQRDQAETVLLQALRGAGARGLAAMPTQRTRGGLVWARPWLAQPPQALDAYMRRYRLRHIDDGSNTDERFARNRLRHRVWPALTAAFPGAPGALAAVADHAQRAADVLREVAAQDLAVVVDAAQALHLPSWSALSPARQWGCLQAWLQRTDGAATTDAFVSRLQRALADSRQGRWSWTAERELWLYRQRLTIVARMPADRGVGSVAVCAASAPHAGAQRLPDPWGGTIEWEPVDTGGIAAEWLTGAQWRSRGGRFQRAVNTPARALKKQFQLQGVPSWLRDGPALWCGEQLLWVAALGVDARAMAPAGQPQWRPRWIRPN